MKIAILGSAGYVGATLFRHLSKQRHIEAVPFVRNLGTAWSLLRLGVEPGRCDVSNLPQLKQAVDGFDCVVNCTLGPSGSLLPNIKNVVAACNESSVTKLVHLSLSLIHI